MNDTDLAYPAPVVDNHLHVTTVRDNYEGFTKQQIAPSRTAANLRTLLNRIARVYNRAGFTIQTILMDNEFEKVKNHIPTIPLHTPAASEHVGEV